MEKKDQTTLHTGLALATVGVVLLTIYGLSEFLYGFRYTELVLAINFHAQNFILIVLGALMTRAGWALIQSHLKS